jgi:hypothetical protein
LLRIAIGLLLLVLLTPFFVLLSLDLLPTLIRVLLLLVFGLLLRVLLILFLALRQLPLLLWLSLLLLLLRSRLLLPCRSCLLFRSLRFGLFLLRGRLSLLIVPYWLSAFLLVLFLCECRNSRSEKQQHGGCADNHEYFHACYLRYQNSAWTSD